MMKVTKSVLLLCMFLVVTMRAQWISIPAKASEVCFFNEQTGVKCVRDNGIYIYKTVDGGSTWKLKHLFAEGLYFMQCAGMQFTDSLNGYIGTGSGDVLVTNDGGDSWEVKDPGTSVNTFSLGNGNIIWGARLTNLAYSIVISKDHGNTWATLSSIRRKPFVRKPLFFADSIHGWFLGSEQFLARSLDGGRTWISVDGAPAGALCMQFKDSLTGWIGCTNGIIVSTLDGGLTWSQKQVFPSDSIRDLHWNGSELWALGEKKHIAVSSDLGNIWDTTLILPDTSINKILRFSSKWGYLASNKEIFHFSKTKPLFAFDETKTGIDDTVLTIAWNSTYINSLSIKYSVDNGATWRVAAAGLPAALKQTSFVISDSLYQFRIFDDASPALVLASFDSVTAESNRKVNAISANNLHVYQTGDGMSMHSNMRDFPGIQWSNSQAMGKTAVLADGICWAIKKDLAILAGGALSRSGLQPGPILPDGTASDPNDPRAGVWRIKKNWESLPNSVNKARLEKDYTEWPFGWGAPYDDVNHDGEFTPAVDKPCIIGDETVWYAANDLDPQKTSNLYGVQPIGIEARVTMFASNDPSLKNIVFKKYELFNRSGAQINEMYLGAWADPSIGNPNDDYVGCDSVLNLGYSYNGTAVDSSFGNTPPAVGYAIIQGPKEPGQPGDSAFFNWKWKKGFKNIPMTAFSFYVAGSTSYCSPQFGRSPGSNQLFNNLMGVKWDGTPYIIPNTMQMSKYPFSGDPVTQTGWYEGGAGPAPGDRKMLMACGPFNLAAGEKQEFTYAVLIDNADSNLNAITKIKNMVLAAQAYYHSLSASTITAAEDNKVMLSGFSLEQNYPNPFNPNTVINYRLAESGRVSLKVFDILGNEVLTLVNEEQAAGRHQAVFSAADKKTLASGVYFYRLQAGANSVVKKMMLMK